MKTEKATKPIGRFAPTPSGDLHLGNVLCALLAYLSVKRRGGTFLVRIEDLDRARCPRDTALRLLDHLDWLGLCWDAPPLWQSERSEVYDRTLHLLEQTATVYPCYCSRASLLSAEAPRLSDGGVIYAGTCRLLSQAERAQKSKTRSPCLRIAVPDRTVTFTDGLCGRVRQNLSRECGDFIVRRADGVYAYQLAVVTDDGESGVTEVVRGDDLLLSTPRQRWLCERLGIVPPDTFHIPLLCDEHGRKLSKSDGDGCLTSLRQRNSAQAVLGALAFAVGLTDDPAPVSLRDLTESFDWAKVRRSPPMLPTGIVRR